MPAGLADAHDGANRDVLADRPCQVRPAERAPVVVPREYEHVGAELGHAVIAPALHTRRYRVVEAQVDELRVLGLGEPRNRSRKTGGNAGLVSSHGALDKGIGGVADAVAANVADETSGFRDASPELILIAFLRPSYVEVKVLLSTQRQ